MLQRDPVLFAVDGFDRIHESDCVNARVVSQIAKLPGECRRRSRGGIGIQTVSSPAESRSAASQINRRSHWRLPPPLRRLPWDIAQDEFGVKGADFIGIFGTVLLRAAQDQFRAYPMESTGLADILHVNPAQDQIRPVRESVRVGMTGNEAGVSSLEFHQLNRRYEHLRARNRDRQRRLLASGQQTPATIQELQIGYGSLGWMSRLRSQVPPLVTASYMGRLIAYAPFSTNWRGENSFPNSLISSAARIFRVRRQRLRRPLTPEQDELLQQEFLRRNDLGGNVFLLIRHTGMRIGECADLFYDCLRSTAPNQWAIHVPLGRLKTERMAPVDSFVCELVQRLRFFRSLDPLPSDGLLLARPGTKDTLLHRFRDY